MVRHRQRSFLRYTVLGKIEPARKSYVVEPGLIPVAIIVSCAGDQPLAMRLRDFLSKSKWLQFASISANDDELTLESKLMNVKHKDVKRLLEAFLASNDDLAEYSVIEFDDVFTIGIMQPTVKLLRHACEMCGCITRTEDDLIVHRRTHAGYI